MRLRISLVLALAAALPLGGVTLSQADSAFKVTGGGQTAVGTKGAGDTIAFTARNTVDAYEARGQVQFVDREGGRVVEVYHGTVECLVAVSGRGEDGAARFAGNWTNQGAGTFEIYVEDNGEPNRGADLIFIDQQDPPDCADDEDNYPDEPVALGRGNVQVHQQR